MTMQLNRAMLVNLRANTHDLAITKMPDYVLRDG